MAEGQSGADKDDKKPAKWIACDFCRERKPSKFKPEHIEVKSTDEGAFEGPSCTFTVQNTEIVPLSEEKKAQLKITEIVETVKKKKPRSLPGIILSQYGAEADKKYKQMLKETEEQKRRNEKVALERLQATERKFLDDSGPKWFQELSFKQMMYMDMLGQSIQFDLQEGILTRTLCILSGLGIFPKPHTKDVFTAIDKCFMNPILFLLYLYKEIGKTPLNPTEKYFCVNDRLMLSAIAYLAMPRTLLDLHSRLPVLPPEEIQVVPAVPRRKRSLYTSPYLEPQPLLKFKESELYRIAREKRLEYLRRIKAKKAAEEERSEILLPVSTIDSPGKEALGFSKRHDGCDQIPANEEKLPTTTSTVKRKKKPIPEPDEDREQTESIENDNKGDEEIGVGSAKSDEEIDVGSVKSDEEKDTSEPQETIEPLDIDEDARGESFEMNVISLEGKQESALSTGHETEEHSTHDIYFSSGDNETVNQEENTVLNNDNIIEESSSIKQTSEDLPSQTQLSGKSLDESESPISTIGGSLQSSAHGDSLTETQEQPGDTEESKIPRPIFLSPEMDLCGCKIKHEFQPVFTDTTCRYPTPWPRSDEKVKVIPCRLTESEEIMRDEYMRLPYPIPTVPTIKAVLRGYWQQFFYPYCLPKLLKSDIEAYGADHLFNMLTKRSLFEMAKDGNPLACFPDIDKLPQIQQLIRARLNFKLTKSFKEKLIMLSTAKWNLTIERSRTVPLTDLKFGDDIRTWAGIYKLKKVVNEHAAAYRSFVRQGLVDDARDFWSTMYLDYFNHPEFRSVFYAYLPSKEEDIYPVHPWE